MVPTIYIIASKPEPLTRAIMSGRSGHEKSRAPDTRFSLKSH
jgi:hypothetical protein